MPRAPGPADGTRRPRHGAPRERAPAWRARRRVASDAADERRSGIAGGRQREPDEPASPVIKRLRLALGRDRRHHFGALARRGRNPPDRPLISHSGAASRTAPRRRGMFPLRASPARHRISAAPRAPRLRWATDGATPSSLNAVTDRPPATTPLSAAIAPGRWAAPDTSQAEPMAAAIALEALASSSPKISTVSSVSGRGRVLIVTSVITASVPNDPASTLQRS